MLIKKKTSGLKDKEGRVSLMKDGFLREGSVLSRAGLKAADLQA